jgi:hypothetical protein
MEAGGRGLQDFETSLGNIGALSQKVKSKQTQMKCPALDI